MLLLAACGGSSGGDPRPARGVVHLDLRLADGSSPAALLAEGRADTAVRPTAGDPDLGPWELQDGELVENDGGLVLRPSGADADGDGRPDVARLVHRGPLEADALRALALELHARKKTRAVIRWVGPRGARIHTLDVHPSAVPETLTFELGKLNGWVGRIESLEVALSDQPFVLPKLTSIALVPYGFEWGASPEPGAGDAGLRRRGDEFRRAWPADLGTSLLASVASVPLDGLLTVSAARGNAAIGTLEPLTVRVEGRRPGGSWERLAAGELPPAQTVTATSWAPLRVDLGAHAGRALELRFSAGPEPAGTQAALRAEHVLWGEPLVLGRPPADPRPSILLVTLDTTRADAVGDGWTPHLDALAADGFRFTDAWANCNSTTASHASILTGLPVVTHGAITNRHALPEHCQTLAEHFRAAGYTTAAAVSVPHIDTHTGFGQGFDRFAAVRGGAPENGALTLEQLEGWFAEWESEPDVPRFLWVHLFDAHIPYGPPEEWVTSYVAERGLEVPPTRVDPPTLPLWSRDGSRDPEKLSTGRSWLGDATSVDYVRFRYRLGVAYADHLLGRLLGGLESVVPTEQMAIVVTADHGESIGERGVWYDHAGLSRETLQVPLVVRPPARLGLGSAVVDTPASNTDIAPTLLRLAGLGGGGELEGRDLLDGARLAAPRAVYFTYNGMHQDGFREDGRHFILNRKEGLEFGVDLVMTEEGVVPVNHEPLAAGRSFLYDTRTDPALLHDLAPERPKEVAAAEESLDAWRVPRRAEVVERRQVSAEEEADLQAMGYAGD